MTLFWKLEALEATAELTISEILTILCVCSDDISAGGVFLIPYLLCLVIIGFPVLLLELSLGMKFRAGDVEAFGGIHRRLRGIGISSVIAGFVIVSYYGE